MSIPHHPNHDDEPPTSDRSRRTTWIVLGVVAALMAMVALHLSGVITAH
jgi:hypothetical protein